MRFVISAVALSLLLVVGCAKKTEPAKVAAPTLDVAAPTPPVATEPPITPIPAPAPTVVAPPAPAPTVVDKTSAPKTVHSTHASHATHAGGKTYVVKKGDTLTKISRDHYGDTNHIKKILAANPKIKNANDIRPGQKIILP